VDREAFYLRLPPVAQNWVTTLEGWRIQRVRFNREFHDLLEACRERLSWSHERAVAFRDERLREAVARAAATMPHYRAAFQRLGIRAQEIRTLADLARLPILTRPEVQAAVSSFTSEAISGRETMVCHTSGSTGTGLHFPATRRSHREQWAVWWRNWMDHGLALGTPCLQVAGRSVVPLAQQVPPFWRYNRAGRQILFSAYHLNDATAPSYLEEMRRSGACWMHGYPSMISLLAGYALELGVKLPLRWVTLGAENVLPHQVEVIRAAFGVEPIQHYGMAEAAANISLCRRGALHVDEDFAAVEFVPLEGDQYRIVGTNFANAAFGLFRYDVGDVATVTGRTCDCGRPGRVVDRIDGRMEDFVVTRRGARLGRLDHVFKDLVRVREAQIRQSEPGRMTILIVKAEGYGESDEQALRQEMLKRVGEEVAFDVRYVDAIPRTSTGKLRFVVSTLASGQIQGPARGAP
jgi:phenylacetate-CoA ligase